MAKKLILTLSLLFSLFPFHVSSDHNNEYGETIHATHPLHMLSREERQQMMLNLDESQNYYLISGGVAFASPIPSPSVDCGRLCEERCRLHSRPNLCGMACGTCCLRCNCVPPGTFGNRELCGKCYTDMRTHANKIMCP